MLNCSGGWKVMRQISANDVWRSTASPGTIQPPMAVLDFAHLTWEEVRDLDRTKAVAILPVGAVEAHGPHLPLAPDVIIAETMDRAAAARLAARGPATALPPTRRRLGAAARDGEGACEAAGGPRAYCGAQAEARAEEGAHTIEILGGLLEEAVLAELAR